MDETPDGDKSAYNSAVQFMFELSGIRKQLHQARWDGNIELRYDVLVSYYMALSARMKVKPAKKVTKTKEVREGYEERGEMGIPALDLQTKHDRFYNSTTRALSTYLLAKRRGRKIPGTIFNMLDLWEKELRKDENALGLLVPDKSDPAFALGGQQF